MSVRYSYITFRPIDQWPGELTQWRRRAPFATLWGKTIQLLERELGFLDATRVVFQVALRDNDLRIDGKPRAQAKTQHPGVILAFDSKYGPLKYAVDTFNNWEDNVRAIALAMEALRKVDRYGEPGSPDVVCARQPVYCSPRFVTLINTRSDAVRVIHGYVGDNYDETDIEGAFTGEAVKAALRKTHPDLGGDPDDFRRVMRAKELLA